jgi:hypothetical protein
MVLVSETSVFRRPLCLYLTRLHVTISGIYRVLTIVTFKYMTAKKNELFQSAGFHDTRKSSRSIGCFYIQPFRCQAFYI